MQYAGGFCEVWHHVPWTLTSASTTASGAAGCLPFLAFLFLGCFFLDPFSAGLAFFAEPVLPPAAAFLFAPDVLAPDLAAFIGDLRR